MSPVVIHVENLSKVYRLGQIGTGTLTNDLKVWWATKMRGQPNPLLKIGQADHSRGAGADLWALRDVSFTVKQGEVLGIIGRNGAGKSTLLKILSRVTAPTSGVARIKGRIASLLEVGTGFHPELTGRENIYLNGAILGMSRAEIMRKFDEIVTFAEVEQFLDTPVKRYSSGMYVRLAFAVAAHLEPEILVVDEVLAVGDAAFQQKCLDKMGKVAKEGRTVLFVSHNMGAVRNLCNETVLLSKGTIAAHGPTPETLGLYLDSDVPISHQAVFTTGIVKTASVRQIGHEIEITVKYESNVELEIPGLGFVISDYLGNPIYGSNPMMDSVPANPSTSGTVRAIVQEPLLRSGTYKVSLWFGNGKTDFFHVRDCLTFEFVNSLDARQYSTATLGFVSPKCRWFFD